MTSKEVLKNFCNICEKNTLKDKKLCPWRSISNDYCDKYESINKDLDRLEVLEKEKKNREILLEQENNKLKKAIEILKNKLGLYVNDYINYATINAVLPVANNNCNRLTKQEYELLKEVI